MSTFTLVISWLTTSNLPWCMNLTLQVPMQYCSLQHRTLLLSPVTSTAGHCFCFGSIPSFFLELFPHWSPVSYWAPTDLVSSSFSLLSFCLFIRFMGFSRQEYWSGLPFPSPVDHILSNLSTMTQPSWVRTKESEIQNLDAISQMTEWSLFISKANHSISQQSKPMPQPVMLKKLKLNGSIKIYKTSGTNTKKDVLFIIGVWNAKVGSQKTPAVTGKFGLGVQNEPGKRLTGFLSRKHTGHSKNPFPTNQETTLHMDIIRWSTPKSNWLFS